MELREFIKTSISDILGGIEDALDPLAAALLLWGTPCRHCGLDAFGHK